MKRARQNLEELVAALSTVETTWEDDHSRAVMGMLEWIPDDPAEVRSALITHFRQNPDVAKTALRLALDLSKDEFSERIGPELQRCGLTWRDLKECPAKWESVLEGFNAFEAFERVIRRPVTWRSVLVERLKSGRGSAIKGQRRGRALEDFVECIVRAVFGDAYQARCRFVGKDGESTEKADFAIPSAQDPQILIEVKAYGATGSKQTDILGDVGRIVHEKRHDTVLLLVTDGTTWNARTSDLHKLVEMQNQGAIARIYTQAMQGMLRADLEELKAAGHL